MTPNEKDYMDRYIYQVIRRLSKAQRDEVRMELEELISDMYTDKGSMEEALTELGDPAEFAKQYQGDQRYLIGPEYFDTYLWFVKVVIVCAAIPILLISLINAIGEMPAITAQNSASVIIRAIVDGLITGITDAILSCVSAFGAVRRRPDNRLIAQISIGNNVKKAADKKPQNSAENRPVASRHIVENGEEVAHHESMVRCA